MKIIKTASGQTKISLNKFDWLKIGSKHNWLKKKASKSARINGELFTTEDIYFDNTKGMEYMLMDIEKPNDFTYILDVLYDDNKEGQIVKEIERKSVTDARTGIEFSELDHKQNLLGTYKITKIHDDEKTMDVEYVDGSRAGQRQTLDIAGQARTIHNEQIREQQENQMENINFTDPNQFFTLGYLAKNGTIVVNINENLTDQFDGMYQRLTEDDPSQYKGHFYSTRTPNKGGDWFKILFKAPPPEVLNNFDFGADVDLKMVENGLMQINNRNFIKNLFRVGFRLGHNSDNISNIAQRIQNDDNREDFMLGTDFGEDQVLASIFGYQNLIRL